MQPRRDGRRARSDASPRDGAGGTVGITTTTAATTPAAAPDGTARPRADATRRTGPRIIVLRALPGLGDTLCAVPALRALRARFPDARITYAGLPSSAWLVERHPDLVDRHLDLPPLPGLHPDPARRGTVAATFRSIAIEAHDLAVQLHGDGTCSDGYALAMGARVAVGPGWSARRGGPKVRHRPAPTSGHEIDRLLEVVLALGGAAAERGPTFPVLDDDRERSRRLLRRRVGGRPYVVLHPGSSRPDTRWPLAAFAAVGRAAARAVGHGLVPVVTGGETERDLGVGLCRKVPGAVDLTGRTGLGELAAVLDGASAVVSNDTGTAHLATAVGAPSVVVFTGAGDPERWRPRGEGPQRVVRSAGGFGGGPPPDVFDVLAALHAVRR